MFPQLENLAHLETSLGHVVLVPVVGPDRCDNSGMETPRMHAGVSETSQLQPGQKGKQGLLYGSCQGSGWMVNQDCYHRELMPTDTRGRCGAGAQRAHLPVDCGT